MKSKLYEWGKEIAKRVVKWLLRHDGLFARKITETDKNKVWAFCSGHFSNDFRGNPKWLFLYINKYRPDITAYWLCENRKIIRQVKKLGFRAYRLGTVVAERAIDRTGVLVSEQVKMVVPAGLEQAKYLNLWHGVGGVKAVERSVTTGILVEQLAKKYIEKNRYYRENELYLAPSAFIESIAKEQLGLADNQIVRAGYPRCRYQQQYDRVQTFPHDLLRQRGLPEDTKLIAYAPTFRNDQKGDFFISAIPDMDRLLALCEKKHLLMIFKMHPFLETCPGFCQAQKAYAKNPWVVFWDNRNDFYEILDRVDLCIMDYSSIFTDFLSAGTRHFIRYAFDFDGADLDFPMDYDEVTLGKKCKTFEELLAAIETYETEDLTEDIARIRKLYWEYDDEHSLDRIVDQTLAFTPVSRTYPTLYSFDIFDTLITRKVNDPSGIFYYVRERMQENPTLFPPYLIENYPTVRQNAEANMREYYNRSIKERDDERCEIQFDEILARIAGLYALSDEAVAKLREWEIACELENVLPLSRQIEAVKSHLADGDTVVLISDMYLPKDVISAMLTKADPVLGELPLYLSSEYGYQKSRKTLYLEVYRQYGAAYPFGKWVHTGDNQRSDIELAGAMNIQTVAVQRPDFNEFEQALVKTLNSYDGFLVAGQMARFRASHPFIKQQFAYEYVALLFVPYIRWALHDAVKNGDEIAYFISRDGHQLKRIADEVAAADGLSIERKYIYASRRTWRIPSFFDHIDVGFWGQGYGNLARVNSLHKLLRALDVSEDEFRELFPELSDIDENTPISLKRIKELAELFQNSRKYEAFLLARAAQERIPTCGYLKQEMDTEKPFSIIEYWGRGYTQENFTRLWHHIVGRQVPVTFYYSRSTLPSDEWNIRKNFTSNPSSQAFIESIFACINYKSIEEYQQENGRYEPVMRENICDSELFEAMETLLPVFARMYCTLPLNDPDRTGRELIDFAIDFHTQQPEHEFFTKVLAQLVDSVELYGAKKEYAKALTAEDLEKLRCRTPIAQITKNPTMSFMRSSFKVKNEFMEMFQIQPGEDMSGITNYKKRFLNRLNIGKSKHFRHQTERLTNETAAIVQRYDRKARICPLENKVLLLTDETYFSPETFGSLMAALKAYPSLTVQTMALGSRPVSQRKLVEALVTARLVIVPHPIYKMSGLTLRPGSRLVVLGDAPVQYLARGLMMNSLILAENRLNYLRLRSHIDAIQIPSDRVTDSYTQIFNLNSQTEFLPTGSCQTDIYFDEAFRKATRQKLNRHFPAARHKKVICYVPYHRYRNVKSHYAEMLDLRRLQKELGEEYVLVWHQQRKYRHSETNRRTLWGFAKELSGKMSLRELMCAADVIVGDYRDTAFEAPLLQVPVFLSAWDWERLEKTRKTTASFADLMYGVPINSTDDLIEKLRALPAYDDSYCRAFRERYLTYCDGHSAEKLCRYLLEEEV